MIGHEHSDEVRRWLCYAQEDLVLAETLIGQSGVAARHICWLAQQSVEKALKAALIFLRIDFPRRHDWTFSAICYRLIGASSTAHLTLPT